MSFWLNTFSSAPVEILENIISGIYLFSTHALIQALSYTAKDKHEKLKAACRDRASPSVFLSKYFGDGAKLLTLMNAHLACISGSMSLEFISKGAMTSVSDCDIFVPDIEVIVSSFMEGPREMGCKYYTSEELYETVTKTNGKRAYLKYQQVRELLRSKYRNEIREATKYSNGNLHNIFRPGGWQHDHHMIVKSENGERVIELEEHSMSYGDSEVRDIMCYRMGLAEKSIDVQVIVEARYAAFHPTSVIRFHSSHVQSFLTPSITAHLYWNTAAKKATKWWYRNGAGNRDIISEGSSQTKKREYVQRKWEKRGYSYTNVPQPGVPAENLNEHPNRVRLFSARTKPREMAFVANEKADGISEWQYNFSSSQYLRLYWQESSHSTSVPYSTLGTNKNLRISNHFFDSTRVAHQEAKKLITEMEALSL